MKPGLRCAIYLGLVIAGSQSLTLAGTLEPPGPPGPTFKTLSDVEPRQIIRANTKVIEAITIDQPGSYYLGENITAIPDNNGITITANDVSLDLNGFTVSGNLEVNDGHGIEVSGNNVTISNGTVKYADSTGIACLGVDLKLINVNSINNGEMGVQCSNAHIINGNFSNNGQTGVVGGSIIIEGARAIGNNSYGFSLLSGSILSHSIARQNGSIGILCNANPTSALVTQSVSFNNEGANIGDACIVYDSYAAP